MPCSLIRWTGACGQSLGGASRLRSLLMAGLSAKLFGDCGKYSSMSTACSSGSRFTLAQSADTSADDVALAFGGAGSLLPLGCVQDHAKAGASSAHSKRFAQFGYGEMDPKIRTRS